MEEKLLYKGCVRNSEDKRDRIYSEKLFGASVIDWDAGFDIRWILGADIEYYSQMTSYSCFPRGTKVLMEDLSYKNIEEIHIGENVITHLGNIKTVKNTMKRQWQGNMFHIKAYGDFSVSASPEHPFLTDKGWVKAKDLRAGQYLVSPKTKNIIKNKLDNLFENEDSFLWVIGLYLAEGSLTEYGVQFSLHKKETEYQEKIKRVFNKLGTNVGTYNKTNSFNSSTTFVFGKRWSDRFKSYGDSLCYNKSLNNRFLTLEPKKQLNILIGWLDGDGCYNKKGIVGVSTSKKLIIQMRDIAKRNGIRASIRSRKKLEERLQAYELCLSRNSSDKLLGVSNNSEKSQYCYEDNDNFYIKINTIEKKPSYAGCHIYNIEVEDDNSYIVNSLAVHNCVGQGTAQQVWIYNILELMEKYSMNLADLRKYHPEEVKKVSAKAIYAQISIGYGQGAVIRDAGKLVCNWGSLLDTDVPSMKPDGTTDETWMINKTWKNPILDEKAKKLMGKEYRFIDNINMDLMAQAIKENMGVIGGLDGINNGSWMTERPKAPTADDYINHSYQIWGHCEDFLAYGKDEFGKFIASPNSWDSYFSWRNKDWTPDKPAGYDWQKYYIEFFEPIKIGDDWARSMFNPMTFTDINNNNNDMVLKKEKGNPNIYLIIGNKKVMIVDVPTLNSLGGKFEEVDSLSQYDNWGTLVWCDRIIQ